MRALRILTAALALAASWPAAATPPPEDRPASQSARLTSSERRTIERVESYLAGIDTMHAGFLQTASDGGTASGQVWLDRPGKLRFEYASPHPVLIVSNGSLVLYYDRDLEQTSYVPLSQTPLWFLVRKDIDISGIDDYRVVGVETARKTVRVAIAPADGDAGQPGSVVLVFQDDPLQLKKWRIVDQQGLTTEVALVEPEFGVAIDARRFDFGELDLPERRRPGNGH